MVGMLRDIFFEQFGAGEAVDLRKPYVEGGPLKVPASVTTRCSFMFLRFPIWSRDG